MSSEIETAEQRFQLAFERLKAGNPQLLPRGTPVSQNNVAKEAGTDPSALRKARYPALIRAIQAWVELNDQSKSLQQKRQTQKRAKEDLKTQLKQMESQRNFAQSQLVSAHRLVLELMQENAQLRTQLDDLRPPPTPLRR